MPHTRTDAAREHAAAKDADRIRTYASQVLDDFRHNRLPNLTHAYQMAEVFSHMVAHLAVLADRDEDTARGKGERAA